MMGTCLRPQSQRRLQPGSLMLVLICELALAKFSASCVIGCCSASPHCPLAEKDSHLGWLSGDTEFLLRWYMQARGPSWTGRDLHLINHGFPRQANPKPFQEVQ